MRLSSSSLVIARARISCSVRSEKRFTWGLAGLGTVIRNILNYSLGLLTTRTAWHSLGARDGDNPPQVKMKALKLVRDVLEPALRRMLHLYWGFTRGMTLGVRALIID